MNIGHVTCEGKDGARKVHNMESDTARQDRSRPHGFFDLREWRAEEGELVARNLFIYPRN